MRWSALIIGFSLFARTTVATDDKIIYLEPPSRAMPQSEQSEVPHELEAYHSELQRAYESLNALNPLSDHYGKGLGAVTGFMEPGLQKSVTEIRQILAKPGVQKYLRLISNPAFSRGFEQILKNQNRFKLLAALVIWFIAVSTIRTWRLSRQVIWYRRFLTHVSCFALFWLGSLVVLPWVFLGNSYPETVLAAVHVISQEL